jgi:hypothetical protein
MKGKRPPTKLITPERIVERIVRRPVLPECRATWEHCWHFVDQNPNAYLEVCCHCGMNIWYVYGREEGHGPYVKVKKLPDSPYYHSSFESTSSAYGASRRMDQRHVSSPITDPIGTDMDDSTVAKWLR